MHAHNSQLVQHAMMLLAVHFLKFSAHTFVLHFHLAPAPTSVVPSASIPTPIQQNGTITCTIRIDLSPEMDVSLTLNTALRGPGGHYIMMNTSQPVSGGANATYTSMFMISNLLGKNLLGNYTCVATLSPTLVSAYIISSHPREHSVQFVKNGKMYKYKLKHIHIHVATNFRDWFSLLLLLQVFI